MISKAYLIKQMQKLHRDALLLFAEQKHRLAGEVKVQHANRV